MKEVLISIQPTWCELIASGEKILEVRKTRPKLKTPFKCYIYCTSPKRSGDIFHVGGKNPRVGNGKVIGEFVCYDISTYCTEFYPKKRQPIFEAVYEYNEEQDVWQSVLSNEDEYVTIFSRETCLKLEDFKDYLGIGENQFYGWRISDLVVYDEPKDLSEFQVKMPPQSWCYVKDGGSNE